MSERRQWTWVDSVGLGLFALGLGGSVLMMMARSTTTPLELNGWSGIIASKWKFGLGIFPSLFWNAAVALIGAQLFLNGSRRNVVRNLIGVSGLTLALSVVFGALKSDAGGIIGERTGAVVTSLTHIAVGVFTGIVALFAVAWFAWLRNSGGANEVSSAATSGSLTPATSTAPAKAAAKGGARSSNRAQPFKSNTSVEGVTAAESAALFPDEEIAAPKIVAAKSLAGRNVPGQNLAGQNLAEQNLAEQNITEEMTRAEPVARKTTPAVQAPQVAPNSPYPEDVRRKGQVPPGAKPLESPNATDERPSDLPAPTVYRWTAPRVEQQLADSAGQNLAGTVEDAEIDVDQPDDFGDIEDDEFDEVDHEEGFELTVEGSIEETATDTATNSYSAPIAAVPTPSWEQPALFVPQEGDEEPVDAYGTPLTLVEKLRQSRRDSGIPERATSAEAALETPRAALPMQPIAAIEADEIEAAIADDEAEEEIEVEPVVAEVDVLEVEVDESDDDESGGDESGGNELYAEDEEEELVVAEASAEEGDDAEDDDAEFDEEFDDDEDLTDLEDGDELESDEDELHEIAAEVAPAAPLATPSAPSPTIAASSPISASPASLIPRELDAVPAPMPKIAAFKAPIEASPALVEAAKTPIAAEVIDVRPAAARETSPKIELAQPSLFDAVAKSEPKASAVADKSSGDKTAADKSSADKISAEKVNAEKTNADKARAPKANTEKASADKASTDKASTDKKPTPQVAAESKSDKHAPEKEVVLQPQAAVPPERATKSLGGVDARTKLLTEIGCLFIEKGRVAVSMLQRQYTMEFDDACKVLDDLQEMGLIGPYLGGQRRDILLTREQWLETVSKAAATR